MPETPENTGTVDTTATTAPETGKQETLSESQLQALLSYDPFEKEPAKAEPEPKPKPAAAEPEPEPAAAPPWQKQLNEMRETLNTVLRAREAPPEPTPKAKPEPEPAKPPDDIPDYRFTMPPQILDALAHEDQNVRGQALSAVVSGALRVLHQNVAKMVADRFAALEGAIPQQFSQMSAQQTESKRVFDDFYGKYPEFNTPAFYQVAAIQLSQLYNEQPDLFVGGQWNEKIRDVLGGRMRALFKLSEKPAAKTPAAAPPQFSTSGSGARPEAPVLNGQDKFLAELFS